jgi:hypothetical protein
MNLEEPLIFCFPIAQQELKAFCVSYALYYLPNETLWLKLSDLNENVVKSFITEAAKQKTMK